MFFKKGNVTHVSELKSFDSSDDRQTSLITGKDANFGTSPIIKTFYEGKRSNPSMGPHGYDWVDTPPKQTSAKLLRTYDRVSIKVYKVKDPEQTTIAGRTPLKIFMIDVQSPQLIQALKPIVKKAGVHLEVHEVARFNAPFQPLYFCYDAIKSLANASDTDPALVPHVRLLLSVLSELFDHFRTQLAHLRASGLISYKLAWTYFPKGSTVYTTASGTERLVRVVETAYIGGKEPGLIIEGEELAFDGDAFNWKTLPLFIPHFGGNQPIAELPAYPFGFHKQQEAVKERLTERGRNVVDYQDLSLRECEGMGMSMKGCNVVRHTVTGRVLIDFYGFQKHYSGLSRTDVIKNAKQHQQEELVRKENAVNHNPYTIVDPSLNPNDSQQQQKQKDVYVQRLSGEKQASNRAAMLNKPHQLAFFSPILHGYSLKSKQWLLFHVDDLRPVRWNDEAYSHLVYPEEQKDLLLSFVRNHKASAQAAAEAGVDDVIMGKGRGLVVLLSGPPGTGKTLSAEAVADQTRRPLFCIQAEDLGTNAAELGAQLKKSFAMAVDWNAVVLLDEADVFMAVRQPSDVVRNELVSIFLRELEYFSGTIFLTTNLLRNIDQAFRSRVDIHLLFNPLPMHAREVLWRKFLSRLPKPAAKVVADSGTDSRAAALKDEEYRELARWDLNGREIKNAVKTVRTWCLCKDYTMDFNRLEAGIKVTAPMSKKLKPGEESIRGKLGDGGDWDGYGGWGAEGK